VYHTFGTQVTIVEAMPNILPFMDSELASLLRKSLERRGIKILTNAKVKSVKQSSVEVEVGTEMSTYHADIILTAVGRKAETTALELDKIKLAHDKGRIKVNTYMQTNIQNIYAIGDCLGQIMLAHVASAQGELAAEHALGHKGSLNIATNPSCVYTNPEFAGVGITEEEAKAQKIAYAVGKFPMAANGKALIENNGEGMVKVIVGKEYNEILGVHILGPRATDLIAQSALAIGLEATAEDFVATIHAHPTIAEAIREAVMAVNKCAIHSI
jgi:dihydrolipoamide dehydrogenase